MTFPSWEKALFDLLDRTGISMSLLSKALGDGENRAVLQRKLRKTRAPCTAEEIRQINAAMGGLLRSERVERYLEAVAQAEGRVPSKFFFYVATEWLDEALDVFSGYFRDDEAIDEAEHRITWGRPDALLRALYLAYMKRIIRWVDGAVPQKTTFDEVFGICAAHDLDLSPYLGAEDDVARLRKRDEFIRGVVVSLATALSVKNEGGEEVFGAVRKRDRVRFRSRLEIDIARAYLGEEFDSERRRRRAAREEWRDAREAELEARENEDPGARQDLDNLVNLCYETVEKT